MCGFVEALTKLLNVYFDSDNNSLAQTAILTTTAVSRLLYVSSIILWGTLQSERSSLYAAFAPFDALSITLDRLNVWYFHYLCACTELRLLEAEQEVNGQVTTTGWSDLLSWFLYCMWFLFNIDCDLSIWHPYLLVRGKLFFNSYKLVKTKDGICRLTSYIIF